MKIAVVGGNGLIGSKLVTKLTLRGHVVTAASRRSGVNTVTGNGLKEALSGAHTVVDATNASSFDEPEVTEFFMRSTEQLLAAGERAGISHHLVLSVVGTQRLQTSGYFRAKEAQESLVRRSNVPHTLVQSTQCFEFMANIIPPGSGKERVHLSPALVQPVAADDVADLLVGLIETPPSEANIEIAGPESFRLCDLVQWLMYSYQDNRSVIADQAASYYGAILNDRTLMPEAQALTGKTTFRDWLDGYLSGYLQMPHVHHPNPLV
jgi:uncharacterized protein YbjT (DUF2867 family)